MTYAVCMLIITWNVNGLRAVSGRNFLGWLQSASPDILCLQEIKAGKLDLSPVVIEPPGYYSYFNFAEKKGYSGVAIYTKEKPLKVTEQVIANQQCNVEGRTLLAEFDNFSLLNVYMPHGGRDKTKLAYKLNLYSELLEFVAQYKDDPLIVAGDFNIAHQAVDLARPAQNQNNIMFTTKEREQLDKLLEHNFIDSYRMHHSKPGGYTWWPYMARARERNIGWRIDYIFIPRTVKNKVKRVDILNDVLGSDHCPMATELGALQ